MVVIIAGSRSFQNYSQLKETMEALSASIEITEIVSGGAYGADKLGERYAMEQGIPLTVIPAQWEVYGKAAGPIRNEKMAETADYLVAFWDGKSKGTKNMINIMKKKGKHGTVILCG